MAGLSLYWQTIHETILPQNLVNLYNYKWLVVDFAILRIEISNPRFKPAGFDFYLWNDYSTIGHKFEGMKVVV